ncbi:MAG TPA: hypothetical protein VFY53_04985 [Rhodoplanes sp.]|nr:hypothetical protein [Rhodoplanes sp.]
MNGEETTPNGKAFAHFVDGAEAGNSYELAWLGKFAWENSVANPHTGDKTVVAGTDDATPGQLYFYFGDKQATGSALDKAGLTYGTLYGLKVTEWDTELADRKGGPTVIQLLRLRIGGSVERARRTRFFWAEEGLDRGNLREP